jgi:hypothetical protein
MFQQQTIPGAICNILLQWFAQVCASGDEGWCPIDAYTGWCPLSVSQWCESECTARVKAPLRRESQNEGLLIWREHPSSLSGGGGEEEPPPPHSLSFSTKKRKSSSGRQNPRGPLPPWHTPTRRRTHLNKYTSPTAPTGRWIRTGTSERYLLTQY